MIHVIADGVQLVLRGGSSSMTTRLCTMLVAGDHNHQHAAIGQREQLDLIQDLARRRHGGGDPHVQRQFGQDIATIARARPSTVSLFEQLGAQALRVDGSPWAGCQRPHIATKSLFGRHAAGRSMRLRKISSVRQFRHDVADRSRAERLAAALGDGARANRFARLDIRANDGMQDLLFPRAQRRFVMH